MKHKRVKALINPMCTYLVISESEYDMEIEVLGTVWNHDWIKCTEEDLINLPTATQLLMELQKQGSI